ncbi:helix-turn-helix domain-containing protein [Luteithermobacter gelatinilyticus]|uniref:helix-turn-helix domain-containing protein n=1 Tax=Luteithermobacter gelatinilyticus TaxID=2582913 RepID=UPI001106F2D3|nr:helix-turn-helix domain-containing protein [Luteithermobacter gelatinilyticus]
MAKKNNKGRSSYDRHIRFYYYLLKSEAWRSLKPGPRALLIELYSLYNGNNNGDIFLSEREAARRCNVNRKTAARYFHDLQEKGFIFPKTKGCFNVKSPEATAWILTEFPYNGNLPTKDFMRWNGQ